MDFKILLQKVRNLLKFSRNILAEPNDPENCAEGGRKWLNPFCQSSMISLALSEMLQQIESFMPNLENCFPCHCFFLLSRLNRTIPVDVTYYGLKDGGK